MQLQATWECLRQGQLGPLSDSLIEAVASTHAGRWEQRQQAQETGLHVGRISTVGGGGRVSFTQASQPGRAWSSSRVLPDHVLKGTYLYLWVKYMSSLRGENQSRLVEGVYPTSPVGTLILLPLP